jgi:hypothetical protein
LSVKIGSIWQTSLPEEAIRFEFGAGDQLAKLKTQGQLDETVQ